MTMTLEQVRATLDEWGCSSLGQVQMSTSLLRKMRDAIDAHLSQPAQVDVEREIACALAEADGFDPDDQHGGLYDLRWSGGPAPEPLGDAWTMDYLPRAEQIAKRLTRALSAAQIEGWPKLHADARIGGTVFRKGVSAELVVDRAIREQEWKLACPVCGNGTANGKPCACNFGAAAKLLAGERDKERE